ncbi:ATP-binding protein [Nocardiopsis halotolerans]|uniref:ATP-binding protein n=1 Tax=Nocardiopsis halotolerans TaxID=124252 RepID=UPI00034897D0|nr:ATP-binding protein [Nocardiopsis halotolerans]
MTAETPRPGGAPPRWLAAPRWLLLPLAALPFWAVTPWVAPDARALPVLAAAAVPLLLLVILATVLNRRDRRSLDLRAQLDALRADTASLADEHLPRLAVRLRAGDSADTALRALPQPADEGGRALLRAAATEIAAAERRRSAAMVACATAAGRVQALTTTMLADLRRMQERHGDGDAGADVLGDLMHLDHSTAQAGRIADSIAVLTGARSGRRWSRAIGMESVVRGAMARIGAYQRVRVHNASTQAVAGFAAEGVIHALAEILDNAARFSPPAAEVHVHVEEVQAGIAIMVEDGGLVMGEEALRRARRTVENGLDLATISGTRLGLSVVGQIAHRYGLSVSFRSSSRGGTAVILLLPRKLIKPLPAPVAPPDSAAATTVTAEPSTPSTPASAATAPAGTDTTTNTNGLPQRRRGRTLAAAESTRPEPRTSGPATSPKGFGAFRSAVSGRTDKDA